jgi:hypothetical protein
MRERKSCRIPSVAVNGEREIRRGGSFSWMSTTDDAFSSGSGSGSPERSFLRHDECVSLQSKAER